MNIFFSPEYDGHLFVKPHDGRKVLMDTVVLNTMGLVQLLALRLGLHFESTPQHERIALYYEAMNRYMREHPNNVLANSFHLSGLSTAKAVLAWRDELRLAGCKMDAHSLGEMTAQVASERLKTIFEIEKSIESDETFDFISQYDAVCEKIEQQSLDCHSYSIYLPCPKEMFRPLEKHLLDLLDKHGATISLQPDAIDTDSNLSRIRKMIVDGKKDKITLDKEDDSLLIYEFEDENTAHQYLAYQEFADIDVWVNSDNKQMDNWLSLMNKPLTGSVMKDCTPQLTEMFVIGVSLFMQPLNVHSLIEWLNMPLHPMSSYFRKVLADTIVNEGGYRNDACNQLIRDYIDGEYVYLSEEDKKFSADEQEKIKAKDMLKRQRLVDVFLPSMELEPDISTDKLRQFSQALGSWAVQRRATMEHSDEQLLYAEQLATIKSMTDAFSILLNTVTSDTIDAKTIDSWLSNIFTKASFTNAIAEQGCRMVVDAPAKVVSCADQIMWLGLDGDTVHPMECAFLYPSEREQLINKGWMIPWQENIEDKYHERMSLMPLLRAEKNLILVMCKHRAGEATQKHPLIVRLEQQVENLADFIVTPSLDVEVMEEVVPFTNASADGEVRFDHADKLHWPSHLSPTGIGTLVEYPFDYLMEKMLYINVDGMAQMSDTKTTMGNVAHAVIEQLFAPSESKRTASAQEIKQRIMAEYEETFSQTLEAKGAILLLPENKLAGKLLYEQLSNCLEVLVGILEDNQLSVIGCERRVEYQEFLGYMDMVLEDQEGHPVVFDFKWTSSKKYHRGLLEQNRSIQLELYRYLLTHEGKDEVKRVAYFLMPEAQLYSLEQFIGDHCTQVEAENHDDIVSQLMYSIDYRKQQLSQGIVEMNELYEDIQYVKDTGKKNLFPLSEDGGKKKANIFSNYQLFKLLGE